MSLQQSMTSARKPVTRFPEFKTLWELNQIGDLVGIKSASRVHKDEWAKSGVPFFRSSDVVADFKGFKNKEAFIPHQLFEQLSKKSGRVKKDDLLVTGGGSIGIPYLVQSDDPLYFKDADLLWFKSNESLNGPFLYAFLLTSIFRKHLKQITHIGTIAHYTIEQAKSTPIIIPSLQEQKKIADFLGAVEDKIAGLRERERLLTQYKKGVMQKIFTQTLRFKADDGSDFPDWDKRDLGEICEITTGRLDANAAIEGGQYPFYTCAKDVFAIDTAAFDTEALLVSGNGANVGYIHYCEGKFNAYQRTYVLDKFDANIFYIEQFLIKNLKKRIYSEAKEGNTPYIVMGTLTELQVQLPHPDEQQKIADFLSAIDDKITAVSAQITQMQDFKKGLLQQMFV